MTVSHQRDTATEPRRTGRADVLSGLVVALGGLVLFLAALRIEEPPGGSPGIGPSTLPTALSVLLVLSGAALALLGLRRRPTLGIEGDVMRHGDAEAVDELVHPDEPAVPLRRLLVVIGMLVGYALIFIPLGYLLSTVLYLGVMVTLIDRERWKRNLVFAVVFAVVVYFGFTELLNVSLPAGVLG